MKSVTAACPADLREGRPSAIILILKQLSGGELRPLLWQPSNVVHHVGQYGTRVPRTPRGPDVPHARVKDPGMDTACYTIWNTACYSLIQSATAWVKDQGMYMALSLEYGTQ